jgi:hypothetical protein
MLMDEETTGAGGESELGAGRSDSAVDLTGLGGREMAELLDRIPGARERVELGIEDARENRTLPLDEL